MGSEDTIDVLAVLKDLEAEELDDVADAIGEIIEAANDVIDGEGPNPFLPHMTATCHDLLKVARQHEEVRMIAFEALSNVVESAPDAGVDLLMDLMQAVMVEFRKLAQLMPNDNVTEEMGPLCGLVCNLVRAIGSSTPILVTDLHLLLQLSDIEECSEDALLCITVISENLDATTMSTIFPIVQDTLRSRIGGPDEGGHQLKAALLLVSELSRNQGSAFVAEAQGLIVDLYCALTNATCPLSAKAQIIDCAGDIALNGGAAFGDTYGSRYCQAAVLLITESTDCDDNEDDVREELWRSLCMFFTGIAQGSPSCAAVLPFVGDMQDFAVMVVKEGEDMGEDAGEDSLATKAVALLGDLFSLMLTFTAPEGQEVAQKLLSCFDVEAVLKNTSSSVDPQVASFASSNRPKCIKKWMP